MGTLGVVGASARAAAQAQLRAGRRVVAADVFADVDLAAVCPVTRITDYPDGFLPWLRQAGCSRWMYTGGLENYPAVVDAMAAICPVEGQHGPQLRRVRDPLVLQEVLTGFQFPETRVQTSAGALPGQWLSKTYRGSGGAGVSTLPAGPYRQRWIPGLSLAAVYHGGQFWGLSQQLVGATWTGAARFQYCGSVAPWPLSAQWESQLKRLGAVLCEEFQLEGWYGVDLRAAGDQFWIVEVNPRYTASMEIVEQARESAGTVFGKAILFATSSLTVSAELQQSWLRQAGTASWPQLADIPPVGREIARGQPICTIYASAATPTAVVHALRRTAYRTDGFSPAGVPHQISHITHPT